jgi:hypothetical protein
LGDAFAMISGSCHCGAVQLEIPTAPTVLTSCNCSICRRLGSIWAYYSPADVRVTGATATYVWGDKALALHHCANCACITHWTPIGDTDPNRMGINTRLFPVEVMSGIRVRRVDGASDTWAELE